MPIGKVNMTILDGGAGVVSVPQSSVFVVVGTCSSGTVAQPTASANPNTLATTFGVGPAVDLSALLISVGATVIFIRAATTTAGAASAVVPFATGTSLVTVSGAPFDAYLVRVRVANGGTVGTTGIRIQISCDAGRTYGPQISIGIATSYAMVGTGLTIAFAAGTMVTGESVSFGCTEPIAAAASVSACLVALAASAYASSGWGGMILNGAWTGSQAATIAGYLTTLEISKNYTRAHLAARDLALPAAYGGAGETEVAWSTAVALDYSALSAVRLCVSAGYYNVDSRYLIPCASTPRMRRPLSWAVAARQVIIPVQRLASRVRDGALAPIVVDPTLDPTDGFVYHDEESSPTLDTARFSTATTRKKKPGFFSKNPYLMAPSGSVFNLLPRGLVMDLGCTLFDQLCTEILNDDLPLNVNGTLEEKAAGDAEKIIRDSMNSQLLSTGMLSSPGVAVVIDRTWNVRTSEKMKVSATLYGRGYVREIDATIGFSS